VNTRSLLNFAMLEAIMNPSYNHLRDGLEALPERVLDAFKHHTESVKPLTQEDLRQLAKAQAKRDRKAARMTTQSDQASACGGKESKGAK
jgi:DNA-binding FadR family transcriptional regulator